MKVSPFAAKPAGPSMLVNLLKLVTAYYTEVPDPSMPEQRVCFGTSGHPGSALEKASNEWHILAISQAICLYRRKKNIHGPLFLGMDTHALSVPALLAAEIMARMGRDPGEIYQDLTREFGEPVYDRVEAPATPEQKATLEKLSTREVRHAELAGEKIQSVLTRAPGNDAPIGGLKVVAQSGWFAARPSGTESIYKIYAESFSGADHLRRILEQAQAIVGDALTGAPRQPETSSETKVKGKQ
jgi:phosphoglucomutase